MKWSESINQFTIQQIKLNVFNLNEAECDWWLKNVMEWLAPFPFNNNQHFFSRSGRKKCLILLMSLPRSCCCLVCRLQRELTAITSKVSFFTFVFDLPSLCCAHYELFCCSWINWCCLAAFSSFWRSPCRSSGHNPPKERQPNINFIIHNLALPLNKLNFQFNCWLPSLFPRFVEISFFNFKRRLGPHCPSTIKSNHSAHSEERNEIDLCVEWAAAAVSIAIPFIIPFKNSKFFHSMNMQQLYWRQITVIILI